MKIVLDTNVLMSAIFFGGPPGEILAAWKDGRLSLAISPAILEEYRRVGEELEAKYEALGLSAILALITRHAEIVDPADSEEPISRDSDDDKFLTCAAAGHASIVVSGDQDLLAVGSWKGVRVRSPREFVDEYLSRPQGNPASADEGREPDDETTHDDGPEAGTE